MAVIAARDAPAEGRKETAVVKYLLLALLHYLLLIICGAIWKRVDNCPSL